MSGPGFLFLAAGGGVVWVGDLVVNPRAKCRACDGTGKHPLSRKDAYGHCRKCGGTGRRLRRGAKTVHRMLGRKL